MRHISRYQSRRRLLTAATCALGLIFLTWSHHRAFTSHGRYADRDFMTLWCSGRALLDGVDPYSPCEWLDLRKRYGSTWMPNPTDPYPLWTGIAMIPFAALPLDWAAAVWLVLSELLVGSCVLLLASGLRGNVPGAVTLITLSLGTFTLRGVLTGLNNGQITFMLLFAVTSFIFLDLKDHPFPAGLALSLIALKPNPFVLFAPLIALWLLYHRRWRCLGGAIAGAAGLLGASWLLRPGWVFAWLGARAKTEATFLTPTLWGMAHSLCKTWWPLIGLGAAVILAAWLGWMAFGNREISLAEVTSLGIAGSLLVTPYAWAYEHTLLIVPMMLVWARMRPRRRAWATWGALLAVPWLCYVVAEHVNRDVVSSLVPLTVGVACYAITHIRMRQKNTMTQNKSKA